MAVPAPPWFTTSAETFIFALAFSAFDAFMAPLWCFWTNWRMAVRRFLSDATWPWGPRNSSRIVAKAPLASA
eukprot:2322878-Pyramimonas_sp.AAC.1